MKDKVMHELLRDLVGTAKVGGNTDEIVVTIEERIGNMENAIEKATQVLVNTNKCLKEMLDI